MKTYYDGKFIFGTLSQFLLSIAFILAALQLNAASPNLVKISTTNADGRYDTGDTIEFEAVFDDWLGAESSVDIKLNTGETVTLNFDPKTAREIIDPSWGVPNVRNATLPSHPLGYGVYGVTELKNRGGLYPERDGMLVLFGGFRDYEGTPHDNLVITDSNGILIKGYSDALDYGANAPYPNCQFNRQVNWVIETADGGLLIGGEFINFGGNPNYNYLVKLMPDLETIDYAFMDNLTGSVNGVGGFMAFNRPVGTPFSTYVKGNNTILEDAEGNYLIAGSFTRVGGTQTLCYGLIKLNADGSVNTTFNPPQLYTNTAYNIVLDDDDPNMIWVGGYSNLYQINRNDGSIINYTNAFTGGNVNVMLMPNSIGGVLVSGYGFGPQGWNGISAIQDDLTVTPLSKFSLGGNNLNIFSSAFAVNMTKIFKNKIWVSLHDPEFHRADGKNLYEGGVAVLNIDGSMATQLNDLFANPDNGLSDLDGIGNTLKGGGGTDVISFKELGDNQLLVGGSFGAIMENRDDVYGTSNLSNAAPDDQIIIRVDFSKARGIYTVKDSDEVARLVVTEVLSPSVSGASGEASGAVVLPVDSTDSNTFENNHAISLNKDLAMRIVFLPNGGQGEMPEQAITAGEAAALNTNMFTLAGYEFTSWLGSDGNSYSNEQLVTLSADITLTAQWEAEPIALLDVDEDGDITEIDDIALIRKYVLLKNSGLPDSLIASQLLLNLEWTNPKNLTTIDVIENIKKLLPLLLDVDEDGNITEIDDIALIRKYVLLKNSGLPGSLIASQLLLNLEWTNPESLTASEIITNIKKLL